MQGLMIVLPWGWGIKTMAFTPYGTCDCTLLQESEISRTCAARGGNFSYIFALLMF